MFIITYKVFLGTYEAEFPYLDEGEVRVWRSFEDAKRFADGNFIVGYKIWAMVLTAAS